MIRKEGHYWCKYFGIWIIYFYHLEGNYFMCCGNESPYYENEFEEIDERIIERQP